MPKKKSRLGTHRPLDGLLIISLTTLLAAAPARPQTQETKRLPQTRKDNVKEIIHGVEIVDPYRWLEDQESRETRSWIGAQTEYAESGLGRLRGREILRERLAGLMRVDVINLPTEAHGRYFFTKRRADQDLDIIYKREGLDGEDEVLIDPHDMSPDRTASVSVRAVSNDGQVLVCSVRQGSEDETDVRLFDVDRRKDLPGRLPKGRYLGVFITPDTSR